jgi:hypothetical protein
MSDNIRIKATPGDNKFLKVNINQKFDFIEILSLKISQDDAYRRFCSDYGVVVGRVIVNNGVGVPNAKVSIFIPVDEEDKLDPEIFGLYPFETVTDRDLDGIPYNLLPNSSNGQEDCFTPIGTFPSKREIQDNDNLSKIYCKYYKFTTTTNDSGDYMLFGLPVGTHFLHAEVDVSDIGFLSQKPYELITQGGASTNFKSPSKYKNREESTSLSQLKKFSPISVNVQPFWGDTEQCEVGITRNDIDLQFSINPSALFMGSIFSDSGKNTLTKKCLPRPRIGEHDQLSTGAGAVEMIRKLRDGSIERFDVAGGEVDDDGTWAYLVPMNLDYVTTSEEGDLVPTDDPTKGIPTRARVRFRINIRGNNGSYLVPNNPDNKSLTDYAFDQNTRDRSFTDLYWNEIYSVKNYIPRIQQTVANDLVEEFTGIKDVDSGSALQFPFNKIGININPLFSIICVFLNIFVLLVGIINDIFINSINTVILILNEVLSVICDITAIIGDLICLGNNTCRCDTCLQKDRCFTELNQNQSSNPCADACDCGLIPYIPYIYLDCDGDNYVIGLLATLDVALQATQYDINGQSQLDADACITTNNTSTNYSFFYVGNNPAPGAALDASAGWLDCQARLLTETLNIIQFDFYNDWINGALYSFQFDISNDRNRFCDIDNSLAAFGPIPPATFIKDTCTQSLPIFDNMNTNCNPLTAAAVCGLNVATNEGIIKKIDNTFYYAPISDTGNKFFATDIINLGSMVDCNWRGTPKIYPYLVDTSFNLPSLSPEREDPNNSQSTILETGFDTPLANEPYLVADIGCFPVAFIFTNLTSCINIRRFCELGAGLDEQRGNIPVNNRIDNNDVEQTYVRGVFAFLNGNLQIEEIKFDKTNFGDDLEDPYDEFRNVEVINKLNERDSSFYFYFGINKGKTSYDKILSNFFPECQPELESDLIIIGQSTQDDDASLTPTGELEIEILNGEPPYDINWTGPTGFPAQTSYPNYLPDTQTLDNLLVGTYEVTVVDSLNRLAVKSIYVPGPIPVSCSIQNTPISTPNSSDGEIFVTIFNGTPNYTIELFIQGNTTSIQSASITPQPGNNNINYNFTGLAAGLYQVIVTDSRGTTCIRDIEISDLPPLTISISTADVTCFGDSNGSATLTIGSGNAPFDIQWSDANGTVVSTGNSFLANLQQGTYSVTVTDANGLGNTQSQTFTINQPINITYNLNYKNIGCNGANDGEINYTNISSENNVEISYEDIQGNTITQVVPGTSGSYSITNLPPATYRINLKDVGTLCERLNIINIEEPVNPLAVNITNIYNLMNDSKFEATATGGWGDTPVGNPSPGNTYEFIWEVSTGGPYQQIQNNQTIGSYTFTILNLISQGKSVLDVGYSNNTGLDVRCRIKGINGNTGAFCERLTQTLTI